MLNENSKNIKVTFDLRDEMRINPNRIKRIQSLTLDQNKPYTGLSGKNGLFCSDDWWDNIKNGKIETKIISGRISRLYRSGQDDMGKENSFVLNLGNNLSIEESIYMLKPEDLHLFQVNSEVIIMYAYDYLKSGELLDIVVKMAIRLPEK